MSQLCFGSTNFSFADTLSNNGMSRSSPRQRTEARRARAACKGKAMDKAGVPQCPAFFLRDADRPHRKARASAVSAKMPMAEPILRRLAQDPVRPMTVDRPAGPLPRCEDAGFALFQGRGRRGKLGRIDLIVVEASTQRQGCGDDSKNNDGAHDSIPLLGTKLDFGTRNWRLSHSDPFRKWLMREPNWN